MPTTVDRPKSWNDDVRWLLARILGIPTGGGDLPVGAPISFVVERVQGSVTGQDSSAEVTITLPNYAKYWWIVGVRFYRTSGSATTMQFSLGEVQNYVSGSIRERILVKQRNVSNPVDNLLLGNPGLGLPLETDSNNQLYFRAGWDAGTDNNADYDLWFVQAIEAQ